MTHNRCGLEKPTTIVEPDIQKKVSNIELINVTHRHKKKHFLKYRIVHTLKNTFPN